MIDNALPAGTSRTLSRIEIAAGVGPKNPKLSGGATVNPLLWERSA
jgi:hypothetical protein